VCHDPGHFDINVVLKALAPTQKEPPFMAAQLVVLLIFVGLTILAAKRFQRRACPHGLIA